MKKIYAIFMMAAGLVACNREELTQIVEEPEAQTYTMTVEATKGSDDTTKALSIDDSGEHNVLNATWAEGEAVTVYNVTRSADLSGTLTAQSSGASTVLKGTLTGTIEPGDELKLMFLSPSYASQTGTLEYIAANCDYAEATTTVSAISDGRITASAASFTNQQAIVKFTLKDKADGATLLTPTALTVNDGTSDVATLTSIPATTYATNGNGVLFVAIPGITDKAVKLTATMGGGIIHMYQKPGMTFTNGQYYEIAVTMPKLYAASKITFLRGQTGASTGGNEGMGNLLDGNKSNKWCSLNYGPATYPIRVSDHQNGVKDQVIWKTASSIVLTNYILTTGGDSYRTSPNRRNWKSWTIYGANFDSDSEATINASGWTQIQQITVTDDNVLQDVNSTDFWFSIPGNNTAYKYYRLVIDEIKDDCNIHQMSEMTLFTKY